MQEDISGYRSAVYAYPIKRYYQILDLKNDSSLIEEYKRHHQKEFYWDEVGKGIREVGILNMEIFLYMNHLVMVVEAPLDFDWDDAFSRLAEMPIQEKWEKQMSLFQKTSNNVNSSTDKWQKMERIFILP